MNERLYYFPTIQKHLTIKEAIDLNNPEINERINHIRLNQSSKRMTKDGFEPGVQDNIKEYCGSRGEYDRRLRELGLVEVGKETSHLKESTEVGGGFTRSDGFIEYAKEIGIELSGNEEQAIKDGTFMSEDKINE
jgi:hypothetical protein